MRSLLTFLSSLVLTVSFSQSWTDQFNWIEGRWITEDGSILETWVVLDDKLEGIAQEGGEPDYVLLEELTINKIEEEIYYSAFIIESQKRTDFKCTKITENEMVFENPNHDFPKTISYQIVSKNELLVLISGDGQEIKWKYFRLTELNE